MDQKENGIGKLTLAGKPQKSWIRGEMTLEEVSKRTALVKKKVLYNNTNQREYNADLKSTSHRITSSFGDIPVKSALKPYHKWDDIPKLEEYFEKELDWLARPNYGMVGVEKITET